MKSRVTNRRAMKRAAPSIEYKASSSAANPFNPLTFFVISALLEFRRIQIASANLRKLFVKAFYRCVKI